MTDYRWQGAVGLRGGYGRDGSYFSLFRQKKVSKEKVFFVRRFGLPPALLFFASPKKSKQKKGEPKAVALSGCLALLAPRGVGRKLATLRQAPALNRTPLRCSARPMAQGARTPPVLVRCAHLAHAAHAWTRYAHGRKGARWRWRLGTQCRRRIRTKPKPINYNRIVSQRRPTNPHRNLPHQHPYPAQKNKLGVQAPLHPPRG